MKKKVALTLFFMIITVLVICLYFMVQTKDTKTDFTDSPSNNSNVLSLDDTETRISYANWSEEYEIYFGALNNNKFAISSVQHLPIYKFGTKKDLDNFKECFGEILSMNQGYNEVPSFNDATEKYDEDFFEENSLLLVYVTASSGSYRFGAKEIYCNGESLYVNIVRTNNPEICTDDMAGWFVTLVVKDDVIADCQSFDAFLSN